MIAEKMDIIRNKTDCTMQLLFELDQICKKEKIPYIAGGIPIRALVEKKKHVFPCMDIYVREKDYRKLYSRLIAQNKLDRVVDEIDDHNKIFLKYVDRTTTFIDSYNVRHGICQGIHIKILPVITLRKGLLTRNYGACNASLNQKEFPISFLKDTQRVKYEKYSIMIPIKLQEWFQWLFSIDSGQLGFPSYANSTCLISTTVGYEQILGNIPNWNCYVCDTEENLKIINDTSNRIEKRDILLNKVYENLSELYRNMK